MEEEIFYILIGAGVLGLLLLIIFWPVKGSDSKAAKEEPPVPNGKGLRKYSEDYGPAFTRPQPPGGGGIMESVSDSAQLEQSAADLNPQVMSPSNVDAMVAKDHITKRLTIKLRPTLLPGNPHEQQMAFVDVQKHWIQEICAEMKGSLQARETDHFLLVSDADKTLRNYLKSDMELRYRELIGFFSLPLNPELWDGKLSVFLFLSNDDYKEFATRLDGFTPRVTETGYIRIQDRMAHIVLRRPFDEIGASLAFVQHLCGVMCHYLAGGENLPRWMLEGLVIYLQTQTQVGRSYREGWYRTAIRATAFHGSGINMLLTGTCFLNPNAKMINDGLACSFALVELLVTTNHKLFLKLLEGIQRGGEAERLIQKLYGERITSIWRVWETENLHVGEKKQIDDTVHKALNQLRSLANPDFVIPTSEHQTELVRELTESRADLTSGEMQALQMQDQDEEGNDPPASRSEIQDSQAILRRLGINHNKKQ